jgi:hypothetical protein
MLVLPPAELQNRLAEIYGADFTAKIRPATKLSGLKCLHV